MSPDRDWSLFRGGQKLASNLKILFAVSELAGIVKTGGLADVASALGPAMQKRKQDVRVVMPAYQQALARLTTKVVSTGEAVISPDCRFGFAVHEAEFDGVPIYLIEHNRYFDRPGLYDHEGEGYGDNSERFAFFCRAALETCQLQGFQPDIIHCHDWQSALLPYYLKKHEAGNSFFSNTRTVLTIHSGAYQQHTDARLLNSLGIDASDFHSNAFEDHGQVNLLKGGIAFADKITTVSRQYAKELLTEVGSHGLDQILKQREQDFSGILNGCDYQLWSPFRDKLIPAKFSPSRMAGKAKCKAALQERMGLPDKTDTPLFGLVSRLTSQKGFDYLIPALWEFLQHETQVILLGSGDRDITHRLNELAAAFPEKCRFYEGYNDELAHWIEAGSDFFLMPSLFEPCGLNQMYSMKYGTLPIVRAVGGLRDSVTGYRELREKATGFVFENPDTRDLLECLYLASDVYGNKPVMKKLVSNAMSQSFTWDFAARQYLKVFRAIT